MQDWRDYMYTERVFRYKGRMTADERADKWRELESGHEFVADVYRRDVQGYRKSADPHGIRFRTRTMWQAAGGASWYCCRQAEKYEDKI